MDCCRSSSVKSEVCYVSTIVEMDDRGPAGGSRDKNDLGLAPIEDDCVERGVCQVKDKRMREGM